MFFADGRSIVETWGTWRFRVMERGTLDGYLIGRVERVEDWDGEDEEGSGSVVGSMGNGLGVGSTAVDLTGEREVESEGLRRRGASTLLPARSIPSEGGVLVGEGSSSSSRRPSVPAPPAERTNAELMQICHEFLQQLREVPWIVERINEAVVPAPADPALFSFWMALVRPLLFRLSLFISCTCILERFLSMLM